MLLFCFTPEQRDLESVQPIRLCRHLLHRLLAPGPETRAFLLLYPARRQIRDCQQLHKEQRQPDLFIYTLSNFDKNESTRQIMLTSLTQASRLCPTRALNSNHLLIPRIHHHYRVVWLSISFLPPLLPKEEDEGSNQPGWFWVSAHSTAGQHLPGAGMSAAAALWDEASTLQFRSRSSSQSGCHHNTLQSHPLRGRKDS